MAPKGNSQITTCLSIIPSFVYSWIIDSSPIDHMKGFFRFSSYSPSTSNKKVTIVDDSLSIITRIGTFKLTPFLTLHDVLHVPNFSCKLLSINKITSDHICQANLYSFYCEFQEPPSSRMIDNAKKRVRGNGLYYLEGLYLSRQCQSTCLNCTLFPKIMMLCYGTID